jgi:hypothetical protein
MADGENQTFASVDAFMEARREKKEAAPVAKAPEPAPEPENTPAPVEVQQDDEIEVADPAAETLEQEPDEANLEGDEGDDSEPAEPAIAPPQFWDAKGKELFAKLPREAQETVLAIEKQRDAFVSRKANEAAQVARAAQAKQEQLSQHIEKLSGFVSEVDTELTEYGKIDWANEIAEATTQRELADIQWHQARFEALKQQRQQAERAQAEAQSTELREFHQEQRLKLKQIAADLDPDKPEGIQKVQLVSRFLEANGIDGQTQAWMPAEGIALAYDALRWRQHVAKQAQPAAQTPKPPAGPTVRPASSASGSSANQRLQQLSNKKTLSQDEFIELGRLKRKVSKRK